MAKRMIKLRKIDVLSLGIVLMIFYAIAGLIIGIIMFVYSLTLRAIVPLETAGFITSFGAVSIIIFPIMYGITGFIVGVLSAFLYNLIAKWTGGIKLKFE